MKLLFEFFGLLNFKQKILKITKFPISFKRPTGLNFRKLIGHCPKFGARERISNTILETFPDSVGL